MSALAFKRNIAANLAGGAWIAGLTLVITPMQIQLLGVEAYGVVGLITLMQVMLGALDFGLASMVTQQVARDHSPGRRETQRIVESAAVLYWGCAVVIGGGLWLGSSWIRQAWLSRSSISPDVMEQSVQLIGIYLALRWPVALYSGLLAGVQRMDVQNYLKAGAASLRLLGGIAVLVIMPDLLVLLRWMTVTALVELGTFMLAGRHYFPDIRFFMVVPSVKALKSVWKLSAGTQLIALSAVVLTQFDRVVIGKVLNLEALGYYTLAYNIVIGISLIQTAVNAAALPNLAALAVDSAVWRRRYEATARWVAYAVALPCFVVIFFGEDLLAIWVGRSVAAGTYAAAAVLAAGLLLNAMMSAATTACVALGRPWAVVRLNAVAILFYIPLVVFLTLRMGLVGAAISWLALNAFFFFVGLPQLHRALDLKPYRNWMTHMLAGAPLLAVICFGAAKLAAGALDSPAGTWGSIAAAIAVYAGISYRFLRKDGDVSA